MSRPALSIFVKFVTPSPRPALPCSPASSASHAAFCHFKVDSSSSAKSCTISLVCRSSFNAAANSKMRADGLLGIRETLGAALQLREVGDLRVALMREFFLNSSVVALRHRAAELGQPLSKRATMIGLALRHHLETAANAIGGAYAQPRADRVSTVGLGRAHRLEESHHRVMLGVVGLAESHELAGASPLDEWPFSSASSPPRKWPHR